LQKKEGDISPSGGALKEPETTKAASEEENTWLVYIRLFIRTMGKPASTLKRTPYGVPTVKIH
jgi:hypothetical protein